MRKQHNVKSSALAFLPPEMREFVKPTRVAHVWTRTHVLCDKDEMAELADMVRSTNKGAVPVFHKIHRLHSLR